MSADRIVDVSDLPPPEPMRVALAALAELRPGERLILRHRREPFPLYPMLAELGFSHRTRPGAVTSYEIVIWRATEPPPEELR
ncbi:MAG: DUF2249 domain-containing protein [Planctomycetes bacterium]|nr:DUF2249 domain-containing protein [Planctomycetota bacterium]